MTLYVWWRESGYATQQGAPPHGPVVILGRLAAVDKDGDQHITIEWERARAIQPPTPPRSRMMPQYLGIKCRRCRNAPASAHDEHQIYERVSPAEVPIGRMVSYKCLGCGLSEEVSQGFATESQVHMTTLEARRWKVSRQ